VLRKQFKFVIFFLFFFFYFFSNYFLSDFHNSNRCQRRQQALKNEMKMEKLNVCLACDMDELYNQVKQILLSNHIVDYYIFFLICFFILYVVV
jgi:hypothetical protein